MSSTRTSRFVTSSLTRREPLPGEAPVVLTGEAVAGVRAVFAAHLREKYPGSEWAFRD